MKASTQTTARQKIMRYTAIGVVAVTGMAGARATFAGATTKAELYSPIGATLREVKAELNLTDDQQARLRTIVREAIPRGRSIHDDKKLTPTQRRTRLRELRSDTALRMGKVITPEQRRKGQEWFAKAKPRALSRLMQVAVELELTESQIKQVQPVLSSALRRGLALKDNMDLSLAEKIVKGQQIGLGVQSDLGKILSKPQMDKLNEMVVHAKADLVALWLEQQKSNAS